jgi:excisionase family DNA binding protein
MGKICIVKRRKREDQIGFGPAEGAELYMLQRPGLGALKAPGSSSLAWSRPLPEDATGAEEQKFSMELTPTQAEAIKSHSYFKLLLGAEVDGSGVNVERSEDGNIVFNFYFKQVYSARMLTSADVCSMLQISKAFLSRLVKVGRFRSYKIGRLRRFSLEDILAHLSESKEVLVKGEDQCITNTGA